MQNIDFLPAEFRQQDAQRQVQPWRLVVAAAFFALLAAAALSQYHQKRLAERALAEILPTYEEAVRQTERLHQLQQKRQVVECDAELLTYLRHPWPRTQIVWGLLDPLPGAITLDQVHLAHEATVDPPAVDQRSAAERKTAEEKLAKMPPAARDLKRLHEELDKAKTLVRLAGTTTTPAALHEYLAALAKAPLFHKAAVRSIESVDGPQGPVLRFQAVVVVRPGYGQPGGPTGIAEKAIAQAQTQPTGPSSRVEGLP